MHAVRDVSYTVDRGEVLGIVGESGSGKSVTNMATMGLLPRSTRIDGSILYDGNELVGLPSKRQTAFRGNEIGMIFQDPMTSLNPVYTVGWQIAEAVRAHSDMSMKQATARAAQLLELVGIPQATRRVEQLPTRVFRRHAPTRDDRHGDGQRSAAADRRRADDGARRDRPSADPRDLGRHPKTNRHRHHPDHPRSRRCCRHGRSRSW